MPTISNFPGGGGSEVVVHRGSVTIPAAAVSAATAIEVNLGMTATLLQTGNVTANGALTAGGSGGNLLVGIASLTVMPKNGYVTGSFYTLLGTSVCSALSTPGGPVQGSPSKVIYWSPIDTGFKVYRTSTDNPQTALSITYVAFTMDLPQE